MRAILLRALIALVLCCGLAHAQSTSDALLSESETKIDSIRSRLKAVQAIIGADNTADDELQQQRATIDSLKLEITAEANKLSGPLAEVREQLQRLGPPPEAGQAEPSAVAIQRRLLDTRVSRLVASQTQIDLMQVEADQGITRILAEQRDRFFGRIFRSDKSVLNPGLWVEAWNGTTQFAGRLNEMMQRWWSDVQRKAKPGGLLLLPAAAGLLYFLWHLITRSIRSRIARLPTKETAAQQMSAFARLLRIAAGLMALIFFLIFASVLVVASLNIADMMSPWIEPLLTAMGDIALPTIFSAGIVYLLCAPRRPEARLISIDEPSARLLPVLVGLVSFIYSASSAVSEMSNQFNISVTSTAGLTALASTALIVLLGLTLIVLRRQADRGIDEGKSYYLTWFVQTLPLIWVLLGISALALIAGYISLSYFIVGNVFDTAIFAVLVALVHYLADAASDAMLNPATRLGGLLRRFLGLSEKGASRLSLIFRTTFDLMLVALAIPLLFGIWALNWIDLWSVFSSIINGFTIGNITLSPWGLLVALGVLGIGVTVTRFVTSWLDQRVLSETTMDKGVQSSIATASSYAGYILSGALALSAAGLDFSNIAIIAGALGVGIGLGLQTIVNNFVSGLILLAERPVRVGDWVATTAGEGIVKKINVRTTEIETFDNCTVIIPNSNLITESVRNWTHRDTVGRFAIQVTVENTSKPDTVVEILRDVLRAHPKVLRYPEPSVQLTRFLPLGLEFDLRGHVADVFEAARVASDVRIAVVKALAARKFKISRQ